MSNARSRDRSCAGTCLAESPSPALRSQLPTPVNGRCVQAGSTQADKSANMALSSLPASSSVSPVATRAVTEQAALITQLIGVAHQLSAQHQVLAGECYKELEAKDALLAIKDDEVERILATEADLRQEAEQQFTVERQQWCLEKDSLQKVLQEQQGTSHTLEQQLNAQIAALQTQVASYQAGQKAAAQIHDDTLAALQAANRQLQQQNNKLEQDLQAALAYRHKCLQQKQELQLLQRQAGNVQGSAVLEAAGEEQTSDNQQLALTGEQRAASDVAHDGDASEEHVRTLVVKLQRERELVKRAYNEEKKKADRYRNAYTQLRDLKQPVQRRTKQRTATGAQSMPQLAGLVRTQGNAVQLATEPAAAGPCYNAKPKKPFKARKGPTDQNRFTAEMDLAAAGLLAQAPKPPLDHKAYTDKLQQCSSWPLRTKRVLQREQQASDQSRMAPPHQDMLQQPHAEEQVRQQLLRRPSSNALQPEDRQHAGWQQQQARSPEELSPGAKQALVLAGLLSEEQEPAMAEEMTQDPTQAAEVLSDHEQLAGEVNRDELPQLPNRLVPPRQSDKQNLLVQSGRHEVQPWEARLAGHAEAIQQLDRDSVCRLSDPSQQPSKRCRSCPPDTFTAPPCQPADSTDAVPGLHSHDVDADQADDAMSGTSSDASKGENARLLSAAQVLEQPPAHAMPVAVAPAQAACWRAPSQGPPSVQAALQQDSLDMTQPNLTPAGPRPPLPLTGAKADTEHRVGPTRLMLCTSPHRESADVDPDLDCDMLPAAVQFTTAVADRPGDSRRPQELQLAARQAPALPVASKPQPTKWKQSRAGQRAAAFAENNQPGGQSGALPRQLDGKPKAQAQAQACWLQQGPGVGNTAAVLGDTTQRATMGGLFKYQEVVRGKADRAALQGIQCLDCRHFYDAVNTWGHEGHPLPACGHTVPQGMPMSRGQQQDAPARPGLHQDASRHRYRFAPPPTPDGLWDLGFGDSQDSRM